MQWFERNEQYTNAEGLPQGLRVFEPALVRVYDEGKTQPGWGLKEFMGNYRRGVFHHGRPLHFFRKYDAPFAILMRARPLICVDIDGKNGGIQMAQVLDLPETLAETSKSGNGYHLYYQLPETVWHETRGYDEIPDLIGLVPGVDIKGTGVVYHYPQQRWNDMHLTTIPLPLLKLIQRVTTVKFESRLTREGTLTMDEEELAILHDRLQEELATPIPAGRRNNALYAIGARLASAGYPAWDTALYDRGLELGLEVREIRNIVQNINKYV